MGGRIWGGVMIPNAKQPPVARHNDGDGRNVQLDGLRAIAVALVLLSHYALLPVLKDGLWGAMGVHAFFVLSGFLITGILLDAKPAEGATGAGQALKAFYVRRSLRIFPLYYIFIAFLYVLNVDDMRDMILYHLFYASNVGMAVEGEHFGHNSHFWSLAVEEQFYLVWPWFVLLLRKRHVLPAILVMGSLAIGYRAVGLILGINDYALRMVTPAVLDSLAAGALLSILRRQRARWDGVRLSLRRWGLGFAAPAALAMSLLKSMDALPHWLQITGYTLAVAWASFGVIDRTADGLGGLGGRVLSSRVFVYLGQRSYAIYVLHLCVPYFLMSLEERLGTTFMSVAGIAFVVPSVITLLLAELSWRTIERPFNGLKRYFDYRGRPAPKRSKLALLAPR